MKSQLLLFSMLRCCWRIEVLMLMVGATAVEGQPILGVRDLGGNVGNFPPEVTIFTPSDGDIFSMTEPIVFAGTAIDSEDGDLTSSISWFIETEGLDLGDGGCPPAAILSFGVHTITASLTDSGLLVGSASVTITVTSPEDALAPPISTAESAAPGPRNVTLHTRLGFRKGNTIGGVGMVQSAPCVGSGCSVDATPIYNKQASSSLVFSCGCEEDPFGNPECTPVNDQVVVVYELEPSGTSTNYSCLNLETSDSDPSDDCTCVEVTFPKGIISDCGPVMIFIFSDGFESGDLSAWSS